jgi:hypothetical protein
MPMATGAYSSDGISIYRQGPLGAVHRMLSGTDKEVLSAWGIWVVLTLAGLCFVTIYGLPIPFGVDEWRWMGQATGNEPVTLAWLWSQHNEHRMFLPRLIYLGLGAISGFDFRLGCYFNVLMLSGLSLAMMKAARAVRGKTLLCDAFFPLVLLHWGQFDNLIWGFQLNFVTSVVLEGAILLIVLRCGSQISLKSVAIVSLCLILLGLCGSYGLVFLPPMACWLFYASACKWLSGGPRAKQIALVMSAFAAIPAVLVALYLRGLGANPGYMGLYASLRTGIEFISFGIGPAAKEIWPVSGFLSLIVCAIIVRQCLMVFRNQPAQRLRATGFLLFFAGIIVLAIAVGFGRAYIGPLGGFETRYITLSAPLLLLMFFLYEIDGSPATKHHVPRILFALMSVLFVINTQKGISYSTNLWKKIAKFEQDMRDGVPAEALGVRYADQWSSQARELILPRLVWLQSARLGLYRSAAPRSGPKVRVEKISSEEPATEIIEPIRLAPGQSFAQLFSVQDDGELCRIDVQVHIDCEARSPKRLDWTLFKIAADGKRNIIAADHIDPASAACDDYISIPLKHVYAYKTQKLELQLAIPSGASPTACVEIPMYKAAENENLKQTDHDLQRPSATQSAGLLRGFIYMESDGPSVPLVARRPGGNY